MPIFRSVGVSSGLIGVGAAMATVLAWNFFEQPGAARAHVPIGEGDPASDTPNTRVVVQRVDGARLAELEQQVRDLKAAHEREVQTTDTSTDEAAQSDRAAEDPGQFEKRISILERQHAEEAADPVWGPDAQESLVSGLMEMGDEYEFSVETAECKTTTCRASLSWPDYEAARKTGGELAERSFPGLNCVQVVSYRPPEDPAAPYTTQLYFDCTDLRAGLVEAESNE